MVPEEINPKPKFILKVVLLKVICGVLHKTFQICFGIAHNWFHPFPFVRPLPCNNCLFENVYFVKEV